MPRKFNINFFNETSDEYMLLNNPRTFKEYAKLKHFPCGNIFEMRCDAFLTMGHRCPKCYGNIAPTPDEYRASLPDGFTTKDDYCGRDKNMTYLHSCGRSFTMTPHNFIRVQYCPHCNNERRAHERVQKFTNILNNTDQEYILTGKYVRSIVPTTFKHLSCGCEFSMTPNAFLSGARCPSCRYKESKSEKCISEILNNHNIIYTKQYTFPECKAIRLLPFDFAIFNSKQELLCLIEFDGEQHFTPMGFKNSVKKFKETQMHDNIKTEFCTIHDIVLYRISYLDNLEEKVNTILNNILYED